MFTTTKLCSCWLSPRRKTFDVLVPFEVETNHKHNREETASECASLTHQASPLKIDLADALSGDLQKLHGSRSDTLQTSSEHNKKEVRSSSLAACCKVSVLQFSTCTTRVTSRRCATGRSVSIYVSVSSRAIAAYCRARFLETIR